MLAVAFMILGLYSVQAYNAKANASMADLVFLFLLSPPSASSVVLSSRGSPVVFVPSREGRGGQEVAHRSSSCEQEKEEEEKG